MRLKSHFKVKESVKRNKILNQGRERRIFSTSDGFRNVPNSIDPINLYP